MADSAETSQGGLGEFEIIARYFAPLAAHTPGAFGLLDDAALLVPPAEAELVLTGDMLVAGVHFRPEDRPDDVAWKALAVNVSDLVAKGAEPLVYLLALALSERPDADWLGGLAAGLGAAQGAFGCRLAGGDTTATPGPSTICVTAVGRLPAGQMVRRAGAQSGDALYVSGTIGDAALGLRLLQRPGLGSQLGLDEAQAAALERRYWRPQPPVALAAALRAHASAAMDISDGLLGDLRKLCAASGTGAQVLASDVPLSPPARRALAADPSLIEAVLTGGDDYEVLAAVPPAREAGFAAAAEASGVAVARIGHVLPAEAGVIARAADGQALRFARDSYDHF